MCACPTKFGPWGVNTVGEEHLRMWHVFNAHKCIYCCRKKPVVKGMSTCEYNAIDSCSPCQFLQCLPQSWYWTWTCLDLPKDELPACGYTGTLARVHSSIIFCNVRTCHLQLQYAARMSSVRAMYKLFTTHLTLGKMAFSEGVVTIQGRIQEFIF